MEALADRTRYCVYCGATLAEIGSLRCQRCRRVARMPQWFWTAFAAAAGAASGGWALIQDASAAGAAASAFVTTGLGIVFLRRVLAEPAMFRPGKKMPSSATVALFALIEALCVPAYWATRNDTDIEMSDMGVAVITFIVLPLLMLPMIRIGVRRGWHSMHRFPTCSACGATLSHRASYCGLCGTAR